jgi:DNA polymerase III delta prime subunit
MSTIENAWVIKYKPKTIDELIAPKRVKAAWKDAEVTSDVLFSGPPGTGKTTLASILTAGKNSKFIDCSTDRGIDTVRNQILTFGTTTSLKKGMKICHLEEVDGLTPAAQNALKATMDVVSASTKFILTTNHPERLIPALHSRLEHTNFVFEANEKHDQQVQYIERIKYILEKEGYKIANDAIVYLLETVFPDIRQTIIMLYQICRSADKNTIIDLSAINSKLNSVDFELYQFLLKPHTEPEIYKFVMSKYNSRAKDAFVAIGEPFLKYLTEEKQYPELILSIGAIVHKYQYETSMTSYNPMLGLLSCCLAINSFFKNNN